MGCLLSSWAEAQPGLPTIQPGAAGTAGRPLDVCGRSQPGSHPARPNQRRSRADQPDVERAQSSFGPFSRLSFQVFLQTLSTAAQGGRNLGCTANSGSWLIAAAND